ncbi:YJL113W-like protein [Saccharomyces cerevisiae FostersB]|nr:YJL113W-like protein [Saccharomyces cerevisiae FostersB]
MKVFDVDVKYSRSEIPDNLIVPTNTIFTKKRNGIYKARIVCRGDTQSPDTYSVITTESLNHNHIKIFLMIANNRNMFMKTLDINHAFLYAKLEEEIYIPHPHDRRCVVKLNKALYGLKQSPKEWNDHLRQYLNGIGLKDNSYTPGLYQTEDKNLMIAVYVDDCVIAASNEQRLDEFINKLEK